MSSLACAGINDFPNVGKEDIRKALPFLKQAGVPYYVHAELQLDESSPVSFPRPCHFSAPGQQAILQDILLTRSSRLVPLTGCLWAQQLMSEVENIGQPLRLEFLRSL